MNAASLAMALLSGACVALVAACGGGPSSTPTIGSTTSPVVAEPTSTPDQPTVTPTPFPGQGVQTLCLEVEQSYPEIEEEFSLPIAETVQRILAGLGLQVVAEGTPCDTTLGVALTGEPLGAAYSGTTRDRCYSGAEVDGEMTLAMPGRAPLTLPISERKPTEITIFWCPYEAEAPFGEVWPKALLDGLTNLWPPAQVIVQALANGDEDVRKAAIQALGEMGPEANETIPALIQALDDVRSYVREYAARTLGEIGPEAKEAVPTLIRALEDEEGLVRRAAAGALETIGPETKEAVSALIGALEDEESSVRSLAAGALATMGPEAKEAVPALIRALGDEDWGPRNRAADALGKIGPDAKEAVPALIRALEDEEVLVHQTAAGALKAITSQDFGEDASRWQQWWEEQQ